MIGRLTPQQLAAAEQALAEAQVAVDILTDGFPVLLETHELTAAVMQVADTIDTQFEIRQTALIAALLIAHRAGANGRFPQAADPAIRAAEGASPEPDRPYAPTPRTPDAVNAIWGRNAVEPDPVQDAHEALWSSMTGRERTDAQQVLDQLADKNDEAVSEE